MQISTCAKTALFNISRPAALAAIICAFFCMQNNAAAQANIAPSYKAGTMSVTIPLPSTDLVEMGDYRSKMDVAVPDGNRLLAAYLLPADLKAIQTGNGADLRRYAMVEVQRASEFKDYSAEDFQAVVDATDKQYVSNSDPTALQSAMKDALDQVNRKLKEVNNNATKVTLDKPVVLGKLFSFSDAYCFAMESPVSTNGLTTNMLGGMMMMRVKNKIIFFYLYTEYKGDESLRWIRETQETWAHAILNANSQ